ncbi:hypothetical protein G7067_03470 [Leucobacter insecticola]|uniref:Uncharacterized protein n=1 Tax=Leucobacter insecticola TaxID=2714934 RepID=A0A6G8FH57_9MICO|nr:hypothetical protein [Leucobacter insecticola]QIM15687.1 hypothetical protein G7067_03470 [Leucobacter insecticola]
MTDVYISGASLPALAAALECAEVGLQVRVLINYEERGIAGLDERGVPDPDGSLVAFFHHVAAPIAPGDDPNTDLDPVYAPLRPVQLRDFRGNWTLQPEPAVAGIPAVPMSAQSLALLGTGGGMRASLDRIKPVLTIGKAHNLGPLVRSRLGRAVLEQLVEPCVRERFGASADEAEVAVVAPGLNEAMTRAGSLSGAALAISEREVARETTVRPAAGWQALETAIIDRLRLYGAEIVRGSLLRAAPVEEGWRVEEHAHPGTEIQARVLVVDQSLPQPETIDTALRFLAPEAWRAYVRVQVSDPGITDLEHDALQTVQLANGEVWSLRLEREGAGSYCARLSGPEPCSRNTSVTTVPLTLKSRLRRTRCCRPPESMLSTEGKHRPVSR